MKKVFGFLILGLLIVSAASVAFAGKGKDKKKPADGVERKYKSKKVKKPVTVKIGGGIEYTITAKGNGPKPKAGDRISCLYVGKLLNDTVFDASYLHDNKPFTFQHLKQQVIAGWDSVMKYVRAGDKVTMKLPPAMAYGDRAVGQIPANSTLIFEVEVLDVIARPVPWDAKGKDTITTPSGLKIVMFETHKDSAMPKKDQWVTVHYSGFLLNGEMFDSSVERGTPFQFPLGQGRVIKGWDEGIGLLHKGEKAKLIIPYQLAYGESGRPPIIPPKSTLIFDVQLVDIK